jgi:tetratricopeptide (TPR) repeat protein
VLAGFAFLAGLLVCALLVRRRWVMMAYGVLWFFIALSVESSFFPIADTMVEHRMYLAMPGVALMLGAAFAWLEWRWPLTSLSVGGVIAVLLLTATLLRNEMWRNPVLLWQDALAKSPGKARVYANLGTALQLSGRGDEAIPYYCKSLALDPKNPAVRNNIDELMAEKLEQTGDDEGVVVQAGPAGPNGEFEVKLPDPCVTPHG